MPLTDAENSVIQRVETGGHRMADNDTPSSVREIAARISSRDASDGDQALLERLLNHKEMAKVWATIFRRHGAPDGNGPYRHSARPEALPVSDTAASPQEQAAATFFHAVFALANNPIVVLERDLDDERKKLTGLADDLDQIADRIDSFLKETVPSKDAEELRRMAAMFREFEQMLPDADPMSRDADDSDAIFARNRGDLKLRGFVIGATNVCINMFGAPLYETVATLAEVAFEESVDKDRVRSIFRGARKDQCD